MGTAGSRREQNTCFFKTLANRGHKIVDATVRQPESPACLCVIQRVAMAMRQPVIGVYLPTRKDPGIAEGVATFGPAHQQHFKTRGFPVA